MPRKKSYFRQAPKNNLFNEKVLHAMKKLVCTGDSHKDEKKTVIILNKILYFAWTIENI